MATDCYSSAVFFNLILVYLEDGDSARARALAEIDPRLAEDLQRRELGESLEAEERGNQNHNFLVIDGRPYYIETE